MQKTLKQAKPAKSAAAKKKKKKKHILFDALGGKTTVQFGPKWVEVKVRIPRERFAERIEL
jgi:hypothetical protein